jgi:ATP synthase protein I
MGRRLVDRAGGGLYGAPRFGRNAAGAGVAWLRFRMSEGRPSDPLARLGDRIDKARAERVQSQPAVSDRGALQQGLGLGFRIGIELVVAVAVATALGWAIDRWLGTRPWGMIVLFFLGVAAGMLSVYRAVTRVGTVVGYRRPSPNGAAGRQASGSWDDDEN